MEKIPDLRDGGGVEHQRLPLLDNFLKPRILAAHISDGAWPEYGSLLKVVGTWVLPPLVMKYHFHQPPRGIRHFSWAGAGRRWRSSEGSRRLQWGITKLPGWPGSRPPPVPGSYQSFLVTPSNHPVSGGNTKTRMKSQQHRCDTFKGHKKLFDILNIWGNEKKHWTGFILNITTNKCPLTVSNASWQVKQDFSDGADWRMDRWHRAAWQS